MPYSLHLVPQLIQIFILSPAQLRASMSLEKPWVPTQSQWSNSFEEEERRKGCDVLVWYVGDKASWT